MTVILFEDFIVKANPFECFQFGDVELSMAARSNFEQNCRSELFDEWLLGKFCQLPLTSLVVFPSLFHIIIH